MSCNNPIRAWRTNGGGITFSRSSGFVDTAFQIPCGQCMGCRQLKQREWSIRLTNENRMHEKSCFLTLTYSPETIPENGTLIKDDLQNFVRRLKFFLEPEKIRFFACGEYGSSDSQRPHYHLMVFNYWPDDAKLWKRS